MQRNISLNEEIFEKCAELEKIQSDMLLLMESMTSLHCELFERLPHESFMSPPRDSGEMETAASVLETVLRVPVSEWPVETEVIRRIVKQIQQQQLLEMHVTVALSPSSSGSTGEEHDSQNSHDKNVTMMAIFTYPPYLGLVKTDIDMVMAL